MAGISSLHGLHQVAQKFTSTTLPRRSESLMSRPWRSLRTISGAGLPTKGGRAAIPRSPESTMSSETADTMVFIFIPTILKRHRQACQIAHVGNQPAVVVLDHRDLDKE